MPELFEVVIEQIPRDQVVPLLTHLIPNPTLVQAQICSENLALFSSGEVSPTAAQTFLDAQDGLIVIVSLTSMRVDDLVFFDVQLRIINADGRYHLDFNFDEAQNRSLPQDTLVTMLHNFSRRLAREFSIPIIFAGLEPAEDLRTQIYAFNSSDLK